MTLFNPLKTSGSGCGEPRRKRLLSIGCCVVGVLAFAPGAQADINEQARRIYDRLTGVLPSEEALNEMVDSMQASNGGDPNINAGDGHGVSAALMAIDAADNDYFYSVTLKNLATPWTNRDQTVFAPLNDYTATVIGLVRDEVDFRTVLYGDVVYVGRDGIGLPAYSNSDNTHYEQFESEGKDFKTDLVSRTQSSVTGLPAGAVAGVLTSRAAARAFFIAGTNRANFRFTMLNHLCNDLEQVHDTSRIPDRIRQDVSRSPGGDSSVFLNNCIGCHSGMDPLAQAFAYYNFIDPDDDPDTDNGSIEYTPGQVQPKYLINAANFPYGYITENDRWDNYWRQGPNQLLGWDWSGDGLPGYGNGAASMGRELAGSEAFAQCQVTKAFRAVCLREPEDQADRDQIEAMTASFRSHNFKFKRVFAESADYCMGE